MADTPPHLVGYVRVSREDQELTLQKDALVAAGVSRENIYEDTASGGPNVKRPGFAAALKHLRDGDVLVVWKLDRLGRDLSELIQTVERIQKAGADLRIITQSIDTSTPMGRFVFHIMGALAQMERELIRERTLAGLAASRERGRVGGRPMVLTPEKIEKARELAASGELTRAQIAKRIHVSRGTLTNYWKNIRPQSDPDAPLEESE